MPSVIHLIMYLAIYRNDKFQLSLQAPQHSGSVPSMSIIDVENSDDVDWKNMMYVVSPGLSGGLEEGGPKYKLLKELTVNGSLVEYYLSVDDSFNVIFTPDSTRASELTLINLSHPVNRYLVNTEVNGTQCTLHVDRDSSFPNLVAHPSRENPPDTYHLIQLIRQFCMHDTF